MQMAMQVGFKSIALFEIKYVSVKSEWSKKNSERKNGDFYKLLLLWASSTKYKMADIFSSFFFAKNDSQTVELHRLRGRSDFCPVGENLVTYDF